MPILVPSFINFFRRSLSAKLLFLTISFVLFAEIVVLIPSIANQRINWMHERVEAAYVVGLALDSDYGEMLTDEETRALFGTANVIGVVVQHGDKRIPVMVPDSTADQIKIKDTIYLDQMTGPNLIVQAWGNLLSSGNNSLRVIGKARYTNEGSVDIIISEAALRQNLQTYARNVAILSLIISTLTACLVYWSLSLIIVRPVKHLTNNMVTFEDNPEDPAALIIPSERQDEIGGAEESLRALETRTQALLSERKRLAALGAGISKISHDLRNILASAHLMSDRLAASDDPRVRKLSPRLISALDRAINLSRDTLNFARMGPENLNYETCKLAEITNDVFDDVATDSVNFENKINADLNIKADKTQIYRALLNIVKNATEALASAGTAYAGVEPKIEVRAEEEADQVFLDVVDNGPGLPEAARPELFEPFKGSFKPGGSGLGIAIAHEILRAHGGNLNLEKSDEKGTTFRFVLPRNKTE